MCKYSGFGQKQLERTGWVSVKGGRDGQTYTAMGEGYIAYELEILMLI